MDIYAKPGTKVRYTGEGGYDNDKHFANSRLNVGDVLTVKNINVGNFMSYVEFEEVPGCNFNTVMFENTESDWLKASQEIADLTEKAFTEYDANAEKLWESLSQEKKMMVFYSVCKRIHKGDVVEGRSYRGVLYDIFKFDGSSYLIGMRCGYMDLHNYIQEGVHSLKEIFKNK